MSAMFERAGTAMDPTAAALAAAMPHLLYWEGNWTVLRGIADRVVGRLNDNHIGWNISAIGSLALHQGDVGRVWTIVAHMLPDGSGTTLGNADVFDAIEACDIAARQALASYDQQAARAWIDALERWIEWSTMTFYRPWLPLLQAHFARQVGDRSEAVIHAERALALAASLPQPFTMLAARRMLGELATERGDFDIAFDQLHVALTLADACAAPFERSLTLLALAELRSVEGDAEAARAHLTEVQAICEPLRAQPTLDRATVLESRLG
jgi:ATP/maltotriose-dependent transcriptional regulator MalT